MGWLIEVQEVIRNITYYGGFLITVILLSRYKTRSAWWAFFLFMLQDSVLTIWMTQVLDEQEPYWFVRELATLSETFFMGLFIVSLMRQKLVWIIGYSILMVALVITASVASPLHLPTTVSSAGLILMCGITMLKYIRSESEMPLWKVGSFWIVAAHFMLKFVEAILMIIMTLVNFEGHMDLSLLISTFFDSVVGLYMLMFIVGVWFFNNSYSLEE